MSVMREHTPLLHLQFGKVVKQMRGRKALFCPCWFLVVGSPCVFWLLGCSLLAMWYTHQMFIYLCHVGSCVGPRAYVTTPRSNGEFSNVSDRRSDSFCSSESDCGRNPSTRKTRAGHQRCDTSGDVEKSRILRAMDFFVEECVEHAEVPE